MREAGSGKRVPARLWHRKLSVMIRLEQVRGEMLERFERVDRRFAQNEQRLGRIEQRLAELGDRIEALRGELLAQLELLSWGTSGVARDDAASDYVFELAPEAPEPTEQ
jgi:hypothetical protein